LRRIALENSKFVGDQRLRIVRSDKAELFEAREVDFDADLRFEARTYPRSTGGRFSARPSAQRGGRRGFGIARVVEFADQRLRVGTVSRSASAPRSGTGCDGVSPGKRPGAPQFLESLGGLFDQAHRGLLTRRAP
jgi:hypothetical protein